MTDMTFSPSVPSTADLDGWFVRTLVSTSHPRSLCGPVGTQSKITSDVESFNGLLKVVGETSEAYGYRARSTRMGGSAYRWAWEWVTPGGHRIVEVIIASKIG